MQQQNQGIQNRNQIAQQLLRSHSRLISLALKPPTFYQNSKSISKQQTHSLASSQRGLWTFFLLQIKGGKKKRKQWQT